MVLVVDRVLEFQAIAFLSHIVNCLKSHMFTSSDDSELWILRCLERIFPREDLLLRLSGIVHVQQCRCAKGVHQLRISDPGRQL